MANDNFEQSIVKELDMRLDTLLQSFGDSNANGYKELCEIIKQYVDKDPTELTAYDIKDIHIEDYKRVLNIIGYPTQSIELMARQFIVYSKAIEDRTAMNEFNEALDYLNFISTKICQYASEYKSVTNDREDFTTSEANKLMNIKNMFTNESNEIIGDTKELDQTLSGIGLTVEQRWKSLEYVGKHNVQVLSHKVVDMELYKKVKESQKYVNSYIEVAMLVKNYINEFGIDVDTIPLTAKRICEASGLANEDLVTNIIIGLISAAYYHEYEERIAMLDPTAEEVKQSILRANEHMISDTVIRIHIAERIVNNKYASILEAINNDEDIFEYNDIYLSDYTDEESYEEAKQKKMLPIVYSIAQTLDTLHKGDISIKDKKESTEMLNSLVDAYDAINERTYTAKLVA